MTRLAGKPATDAPRPSAPIRLVAIDLDGTLLRSDKRISLRNVFAIQEAGRRGVKVVIASARPPRSTREIYQKLGLDTLQIAYNGALVVDWGRARYTQHLSLCNRVARQIVDEARRLDPEVIVSIELLDRWLTDKHDPASPLLTETAKTHHPDFVGPLDECLKAPVTKLMLLAPPAKMGPIREMLRQRFAGQVAVFVSDDHLTQVCHPMVDKAAAVAWVAQQYGVAPANVLAIGDAPNDAAMLRWAGFGVAVGNAWPRAREVANAVVASNDDDGVAEAVERFVLA